MAWRPAREEVILDAGGEGLTTAVIRPGMVFGGSGGLFAGFFQSAVEEGAAEALYKEWEQEHPD